MGEKEFYVLEYVNERINGNDKVKYNCDIEEEFAVNEIAHYLKRLVSKRYITGRDWAVTNDQDVSKYKNNVVSIDYKKLKLTNVARKEMNKKCV
ncbi:hypothetical protein NNC19_05740 [Clostridium sp. SHJSY1]|uniref:hypothetical protein n=1 Tax=Clostridium sp. SHJSY1 TaxID=2942483 RepID=UPI0028752660|nr:hypothetical protein [Clostridium sp. SHJSY1]MDS0525176.1 hypothetical protein [Clostridium sp. SHJSY1]